MKPKILITAGDPLGIGPEITVKALASRFAKGLDITVIGDSTALRAAGFKAGRAAFIPVDAANLNLKKHYPNAAAGLASFKAVDLAVKLITESGLAGGYNWSGGRGFGVSETVRNGVREANDSSVPEHTKRGGRGTEARPPKADDAGFAFPNPWSPRTGSRRQDLPPFALVTAPISKEAWQLAGINYTGHTELFRARTGREPLMGFTAGKARTALVTEHFSIKRVSAVLTIGLVMEKALLFAGALKAAGFRKPRITLAALNPHAGDGGLLGTEEITVLKPAAARLKCAGLDITGPVPADAAWREHLNGRSDGLLCLYHDQALVPLKLIPGAERAVHWTWGLPFIRTSPAHGTAFDIAGRGAADAGSMNAALAFAAEAGKRR